MNFLYEPNHFRRALLASVGGVTKGQLRELLGEMVEHEEGELVNIDEDYRKRQNLLRQERDDALAKMERDYRDRMFQLRQERDVALAAQQQKLVCIRAEYKATRREEKELFKPENFKIYARMSLLYRNERNFVARYTAKRAVKLHRAKYWFIWSQFDDQGQFLRFWEGPALRENQPFPEFLRHYFHGYRLEVPPEVILENWRKIQEQHGTGVASVPPDWLRCSIEGEGVDPINR